MRLIPSLLANLRGLRILFLIRQAEFDIERSRRMQEWADEALQLSEARLRLAGTLARPIGVSLH